MEDLVQWMENGINPWPAHRFPALMRYPAKVEEGQHDWCQEAEQFYGKIWKNIRFESEVFQ